MMIQSKADPGVRNPISVTCFLKTTVNLQYQILLILDFSRYILDDDEKTSPKPVSTKRVEGFPHVLQHPVSQLHSHSLGLQMFLQYSQINLHSQFFSLVT